jgi:1-acyl-sn-glycerol-3-phosphate acyltransferase
MFSPISSFILKLLGWNLDIQFDLKDVPKKFVIIVIPHTSNWDFPLGLLVRSAMNLDIKYAGKNSLFVWPIGAVFRWLGGYPVDRSRRTHFVDSVVDIFNEKEEFAIAIAPEGTRKKVEQLKTGFYFIAKKAGIPILLCSFDYSKKTVSVSEPFFPTDDMDADFAFILDFYKGVVGKVPEYGFMYGKE